MGFIDTLTTKRPTSDRRIDTFVDEVAPDCMLYLPLARNTLRSDTLFSLDSHRRVCTVTGAKWTPRGRQFDGVDDFVVLGAIYSPTLSIAVSFSLDNLSATRGLMGRINGCGTSEESLIRVNTDGQLQVNFRANAADNKLLSGAGLVTFGHWYQMLVTFTKGRQCLYLDSQLIDMESVDDWLEQGASLTRLGHEIGYANWTAGLISEVVFWNREVTPLEVRRLWLANQWRYQ